jgi:dTMP kinase
MPSRNYIGNGLPYTNLDDLSGHLIVIEGSDGVGRSTQIRLLTEWLEIQGYGVVETGWTRSQLLGTTIDLAKAGNTVNALTFNLLYATDFADRLEHKVIPALRSGFVVLADRYIYTAIARALVRGTGREWIQKIYGFAVEPDLILYLKVDVKTLINRVLLADGLDYWEAGMDHNQGLDPYDSFRRYQGRLVKEFNDLAKEFDFKVVNAKRDVERIQKDLRKHISELLGLPAEAIHATPVGTHPTPSPMLR